MANNIGTPGVSTNYLASNSAKFSMNKGNPTVRSPLKSGVVRGTHSDYTIIEDSSSPYSAANHHQFQVQHLNQYQC